MNCKIYDYAIIGAGPAGCFAAWELSKKGKSVIVFEKGTVGERKVCGDGISKECVALLKKLQFPVDEFERYGATRIENRVIIDKNNQTRITPYSKEDYPYGLSRNLTNQIFQDFVKKEGIEIVYGVKVDKFDSGNSLYSVGGYCFKDYVIASGVYAKEPTNGLLIHNLENVPIGISMTLRAQTTNKPFFLFDYNPKYNGTYAWIFKIEDDLWNVGLWLKQDKKIIKKLFDEFMETRVKEVLGQEFKIIYKAKAQYLATVPSLNERCVGDASGACSDENGEGIRQAILSAIEYDII